MTRSSAPLALPLNYPVVVERESLLHLGALVQEYAPNHRYAIIADATVDRLHGDSALAGFPAESTLRLTVPSGEQEKTRARWSTLTDALLDWGAGRDTTIVALGGGVTGDLAGFVAATLHRGVPVVQVPTTLLAMVDSSVGGKTGVDTQAGKNLVGAFHDPSLVVVDPNVLATLPVGVRAEGLAEMIKHGLIADADLFGELCGLLPLLSGPAGAEADELPALIARNIGIKAGVVARDGREAGVRQILNAGHTIGHAIEHRLNFAAPHGLCVAVGLVVEAHIAEALGVAEPGLAHMVADAVRRAGLPDTPGPDLNDADIISATRGDKKSRAGHVRYALPTRLGEMADGDTGAWSRVVTDDVVRDGLDRARKAGKNPIV